MKITKNQLKRIIREERALLENRQMMQDPDRFREIMTEIAELVDEAWELAGRPDNARGYWYNGILGRIDPGEHGIGYSGVSMRDTFEDQGGVDEEDMMEMGYEDGLNDEPPKHPDNEFYMTNYNDAQRYGRESV